MPHKLTKRKSSHLKEAGTNNVAAKKATTANRAAGRKARLGKRSDVESLALLNQKTVEIYHNFYKEIFGRGALDRKTKELIAIAASAIAGCEGCLVGHLRKARALGAKPEEIKEAVAVAFAVNAASVVDRTDVAAAMIKIDESAD